MRAENIKIIIAWSITAISIMVGLFVDSLSLKLRLLIAFVAVGCIVYCIWNDVHKNCVNERVCKNNDEIKNAMLNLIKTPGRVCILSRNLSWVNEEIEKQFEDKKGDAIIFAQRKTELTRKLESYGVTVKYYGEIENFSPKTRFTIIRYGTQNPQIAIADTSHSLRNDQFRHIIYETSLDGHRSDKWITSLAEDMISLFDKVCTEIK